MRTVSGLGVLEVVVLFAVAVSVPVGAQVLADAQGVAVQPANPFTPPPCTTPVFNDVPCSNYFSAWIDQLYADQVSTGCPYPSFCPDQYVTRAQMSAFLERAMHGTANWSPGDLGSLNTGLGAGALLNNTVYAHKNTAIGSGALYTQSYTNGNTGFDADNTAVGTNALYANQPYYSSFFGMEGSGDTAVGVDSLLANVVGFENTAVGFLAGGTYTSGYRDTYIGVSADAAGDGLADATAIGWGAVVDASNHVRIGSVDVTQIGGQVGWSNLSDIRAKTNIQDLDLGLDFVMALRPVSFQLIKGNGRTDMGFIAQDVEAVLGDGYNVLGIGGDKDRTLSLRYTDLIAPLVKAVQEQQATITAQQTQIENQKADIAARDARIAALEARATAQDARIGAVEKAVAALSAKASGPAASH